MISVEALIKLVRLTENSDEVETGRKIRSVLMPVEYTRLDRLVDVMFTAATDIEPVVAEEIVEPASDNSHASENVSDSGWEFTDSVLLQQKRDQIVGAIAKLESSPLVKKTRALYWTADHQRRIVCTISKRYLKSNSYWYAYHPQWDDFLTEAIDGKLVLGGMDLRIAFAIPRETIHGLLQDLSTTESERGIYWHVKVLETEPGKYELHVPKRTKNFPLTAFKVELPAA